LDKLNEQITSVKSSAFLNQDQINQSNDLMKIEVDIGSIMRYLNISDE
jgi:hypothetical protein